MEPVQQKTFTDEVIDFVNVWLLLVFCACLDALLIMFAWSNFVQHVTDLPSLSFVNALGAAVLVIMARRVVR